MRRLKPKTSKPVSIMRARPRRPGNYTLAQLPAGTYQVTVAAPGFKKYSRTGLTVEVAQTLRIDIGLEVGSATDSVTVTEAASLLRTESGELSHNVDAKKLDELPVLGIGGTLSGSAGIRNPYSMVRVDSRLNVHPQSLWCASTARPPTRNPSASRARTPQIPGPPAFRSRLSPAWMRFRKSPFRPATMPRNTARWAAACSTSR